MTQMVDHLVKDAIKLGKGKSQEQLDKIMKGVIAKQAKGVSDNDKHKLEHGMHSVVEEVKNCFDEGLKPAND